MVLPPPPKGRQGYRKVRDRASYAGGLASVAVAGDAIALGCGGAEALARAPRPRPRWRPARRRPTRPRPSWPTPSGHGGADFKIHLTRRLITAALQDRGA